MRHELYVHSISIDETVSEQYLVGIPNFGKLPSVQPMDGCDGCYPTKPLELETKTPFVHIYVKMKEQVPSWEQI